MTSSIAHNRILHKLHTMRDKASTISVPAPRIWAQPVIPLSTYWWTYEKNFGDLLTTFVLRRHGFALFRASATTAQLFGVGSSLQVVPEGFTGHIWGTGQMYDQPSPDLSHAHVHLVRGELTRDGAGLLADTPLGDPGLIVDSYIRRPPADKRYRLAVVPHFTHKDNSDIKRLSALPGARVIDVQRPPAQVLREIAGAQMVVSTSLHGLITADSFGIPATWALVEPVLTGGDVKFRDHQSAIGLGTDPTTRRSELGALRKMDDIADRVSTPNPDKLAATKSAITVSINELAADCAATAVPVWRLAQRSTRSSIYNWNTSAPGQGA